MKKFLIGLFVLSIVTAFAGPHHHHHRGHRDHGYPPPRGYYYGRYYRNDGVRLAADIVGLVGTSLSILNPPRPIIVTSPSLYPPPPPTQTIIQQPIIIKQPRTSWIKVKDSDGRIYYQRVVCED